MPIEVFSPDSISMSYQICNWPQDKVSLKQRESVTFWLPEDILGVWLQGELTWHRGASATDSDLASPRQIVAKDQWHCLRMRLNLIA